MNKELKRETDAGSNVINLSNHQLTKMQRYLLQLGHGFVVTPNNKDKEEELLILEGFRVTDRIRKLDWRWTAEEGKSKEEEEKTRKELEEMFNSSSEEFSGFSDNEHLFERPKSIPQYLRYSQPKEGQLNHPLTKKIQKEFEEFNKEGSE